MEKIAIIVIISISERGTVPCVALKQRCCNDHRHHHRHHHDHHQQRGCNCVLACSGRMSGHARLSSPLVRAHTQRRARAHVNVWTYSIFGVLDLQLQLLEAEKYAQDIEMGMWRNQAMRAREKAQAAWRQLEEQYNQEAGKRHTLNPHAHLRARGRAFTRLRAHLLHVCEHISTIQTVGLGYPSFCLSLCAYFPLIRASFLRFKEMDFEAMDLHYKAYRSLPCERAHMQSMHTSDASQADSLQCITIPTVECFVFPRAVHDFR